jgi:hypothetical protein
MTPTQRNALFAFWHRTRKVFVPLTVSEIETKSQANQYDRTELAARKLIVCIGKAANSFPGSAIYQLTPEGQRWVRDELSAKQNRVRIRAVPRDFTATGGANGGFAGKGSPRIVSPASAAI